MEPAQFNNYYRNLSKIRSPSCRPILCIQHHQQNIRIITGRRALSDYWSRLIAAYIFPRLTKTSGCSKIHRRFDLINLARSYRAFTEETSDEVFEKAGAVATIGRTRRQKAFHIYAITTNPSLRGMPSKQKAINFAGWRTRLEDYQTIDSMPANYKLSESDRLDLQIWYQEPRKQVQFCMERGRN